MQATRRRLLTASTLTVTLASVGVGLTRRASAVSTAVIDAAVPSVNAADISGKPWNPSDLRGKLVVLEWTSPSCPFVRAQYSSGRMQALQRWAVERSVTWLSVLSTAKQRADYLPPREARLFNEKRHGVPTALLMDEDGQLGHAFGARNTPHMFVIDRNAHLAYAGAIDDRPTVDHREPGEPINYVKAALENLLAGRKVAPSQTRAYGCVVGYEG